MIARLAAALLVCALASPARAQGSFLEKLTGRKAEKARSSVTGMPVPVQDAPPADFEAALLKSGWELNAEAQAGLDAGVWEKVHVLSLLAGDQHVTIEQSQGRSNREPVPFLDKAEDGAPRRAGAVRGVGKHLASTSAKGNVLYLDLTNKEPIPDRKRPDTKYAMAGKVQDGSIHIFDAALLEDALAAAGFDKDQSAKAKADFVAAFAAKGKSKDYVILGEKTTRLILQIDDAPPKYFWP